MKMYILDVKIEIAECTDETRVYRDFLLGIEKLTSIFVEMRQILFAALIDHHATLIKDIDDFRQHMRLKEARKDTEFAHSHFAFATDDDKSSFKEKRQAPQACICELMHWFFECPYLNKTIRTSEWKSDSTIQVKIDEILKKNSIKKVVIEKSIAKFEEIVKNKNKKPAKKTSKSNDVEIFIVKILKSIDDNDNDVFSVSASTFYSNNEYYLRSFWIVDHDVEVHVANETMKNRFIKDRDCIDDSMILSNNESLSIESLWTHNNQRTYFNWSTHDDSDENMLCIRIHD